MSNQRLEAAADRSEILEVAMRSLVHRDRGDWDALIDAFHPDAQIVTFRHALDLAAVDMGQHRLDAVPACISAQGIQRVEAHGLVVEESHIELDGVIMA